MYGSKFFYNSDSGVEDAKIVSQTYRASRNSYDPKLLEKIKTMREKGFGKSLLEKNKYTVRGALIGGIVMIGTAMFFKKNLWGFSIIGIASGSLIGNVVGRAVTSYKENKESKEVSKNEVKSF